MTRPRSSIFVCTLPRSGSSLLAHLLGGGGAGRPAEWFWREDVARNKEAWGVSGWAEYLERVLDEGTSPNGVFGAKLMWGYLSEFLFELRRLSREHDADDLSVLRAFFPEPRFVWLRRRDVVAQAVSWARAVQTDQWAANRPTKAEPTFDYEQIDDLYHEARVHDGAWRRWFEAHEVDPVCVVYEDLCADAEGVTREVLSFLGLAPEPGTRLESPSGLTKQADKVSAEWAARYRELAGSPEL